MPTAVDLFAGCGGLSKGFSNAGFNIVAAFENWHAAAETYRNNFTHPVFEMDISHTNSVIPIINQLHPDFIIGGPPCQDFSFAGKRIEADRASLTESFAQIISNCTPDGFIMENVDRARKSQAYARARELYHESGYGLTEIVLDASLCGVPQKRKRFICFGLLNEPDGFAMNLFHDRIGTHHMTLREYFGDTLGFQYYYRHPRTYNRRAVFSIDEPAPTMRGVNRPIPQGYPGHPNDAAPIGNNVHPLSTEERALIQTFPDTFNFVGCKTDVEQMIGNAVPVALAEFIANIVINEMEARTVDTD